jgi:radical SAM protein with 4Fe4S-binding SPASM domain
MAEDTKTKEQIISDTIMVNAKRQSVYCDQVQVLDGIPLFSWVDINATELCTRRCKFCPRGDPARYPNQNLNIHIDLCRKIADELRTYDFHGSVIFCGYGEPLLHKNIVDLIGVFGKSVHIEMVTNGDKLTVPLLKELYSAGLNVAVISLYDGPHQVDYFKEMFAEAGLSEEHYFLRDRWYSANEDYGLFLTNRAGTVQSGCQRDVVVEAPCYYTAYFLLIDWNGDIMLCTQDWNKKVKFGNVHEQSLLEVWKSENMTRFRRPLVQGERKLPPCSNCNVLGTLHGYNHAKLWKEIYKGMG